MTSGLAGAIVITDYDHSIMEDRTMESTLTSTVDLDDGSDEEILVHEWRTEQLRRLGLPRALADRFAGLVDWHQIADLVERGCAPDLALEIAR